MVYLDKAWDMKDIPGGMLVCVVCCADSELVVLFVPLLVPMVYLDKAWDMKDIPGGTLLRHGLALSGSHLLSFSDRVLSSACLLSETLEELHSIRDALLNNYAACKLKRGDFDGAIEDSSSVLSRNENNAKALFRRAQAYLGRNELEPAIADLTQALKVEPNDGGIKRELAAAKKKLATRKEKEKAAYAKMFG
ncbi:unnamed protein product [Closterium sp. NIES-53]